MTSVSKDKQDSGNEIVVTLNGVAASKEQGESYQSIRIPDKRLLKDLTVCIKVLNNRLAELEKGSKRYERALQRRIELERQLSRETLFFDSFFEKSSFFKRIREELTSIADIVSTIDFGGLKVFFKGLHDSCLDLSSYSYMISRFASSGFSLKELVSLENKVESLSDALGGDLYGAIEKTDELIDNLLSDARDEFGRYRHGPDAGVPPGRGSFIIKTRAEKTGRDIGKSEELEANTRAVEGLTRAIEGEVKGESVSKNTAIGGGKGSFIIKTRAERDEHGRYSKGPMPEIFSVIDDYIGELESSLEDVENCFGELDFSNMDNSFDVEFLQKAEEIRASIQETSLRSEYETEMMWVEKLHEKKMLSEEEYEAAKLKLRIDYAGKAAQKTNEILGAAADLSAAIQSAETANLEAEYQARLTAAGDNAEQREQIEAEYEAKKLDLQKKYADVDMVINIAKAVAAGALAAVQAYAAAEGNPVLGSIFAGMIAATTAAEIATIIAQRNAIKSQTVSMPTSSASAAGDFSTETSGGNIGSRVVTGYARGGYTEDHTTLTTVGERGTEWIAPHWMVKQNPITFANLESYRRAGSHGRSGSVARGFADGGYTPGAEGGENGFSAQLAAILSANTDASNRLASLIEKGVHAYVVLSELNQAQDKQNRFNEKTSR